MTNQEAIEIIKNIEYMQCDCTECLRRRPALQMAIEALEKQIVYCKSCMHGGDYKCQHKNGLRFYKDDDFCSYGRVEI